MQRLDAALLQLWGVVPQPLAVFDGVKISSIRAEDYRCLSLLAVDLMRMVIGLLAASFAAAAPKSGTAGLLGRKGRSVRLVRLGQSS